MVAPSFYRPADAELCQGDIFERVPLIYLKEKPQLFRKATVKAMKLKSCQKGSCPRLPRKGASCLHLAR